MWDWFKTRTKSGGSSSSQAASLSTDQNAELSTRVDGDHNNVVNIVVQGGSTQVLPLRPKPWTGLPQDSSNVAPLLMWQTRLAPLLGRDQEMAQLRAWADSEYPVSIQLLHAQGGQGKTRLAGEFAAGLEGWRHGWVDLKAFSEAEALTWQGRCLLLVDYPEHQHAQLERLARAVERAAEQAGQRLRILLLARDAHTVQAAFANRACAAWMSPPLTLPELPSDSGHVLVNAALEQLGAFYRRTVPPVSVADFETWRERHPLHHNPLLATALAIDLAQSAERRASADQWLNGPKLLDALVRNETQWWEKAAAGVGAPSGALTTVMAWATLSGRLSDRDINQTLAPDQGWSDDALRAVHAALATACRREGEHGWAPLEPDLLGAHFIDSWLGAPERQGREGRDGALALALLRADSAEGFAFHLNRLHMLAYDQTVRLGLRAPADAHRLERVVGTWAALQPPLLAALVIGLDQRSPWPGLSWLAVTILQRRLEALTPNDSETLWAHCLHSLANRLSEAGDREGALARAREAVAIQRRLAVANPSAHEPNLAHCLQNLANRLSETGDRIGALVPAQEATAIQRRLASANPLVYEPDLALSLDNLACFFSDAGERARALVLAREAVIIYRGLVNLNAGAHEASLAGSLNNLSNRLSEMGDRTGARDAAQEAVEIYRRLAMAVPAAYEPGLAMSLSNLSSSLSEIGDCPAALRLAQEALVIRRRLALANPAAYEPDLAASLNNLGIRLSEAGDRAGALAPAQESVAIRRRLAQTNPAAYEPDLAVSLGNLANHVSVSGDRAGALALAQEVVAIRRRLAQANPAAYAPNLAVSLNNLASFLSETGDRAGALAPAQEAVAIYRGLAQANPVAYEPHLAVSLGTLMMCRAATQAWAEARCSGEEALRLFEALAQRWPQRFESYLGTTRATLDALPPDD